MEPRLNYATAAPGAYQAMAGIERYVRHCGLEASLLELVKTRASQISAIAWTISRVNVFGWPDTPMRAAGFRARTADNRSGSGA